VTLAHLCRDGLVVAPALFLCAGSAHAQRAAASVDVGAVALRYADTVNATAAALTPDLRIDWSQGTAEALGTISQFGGGGWSAQGNLSASLFTPKSRGFFGELTGSAGGSTHQDATRTGESLAHARIHFARSTGGVFVGGGGGTTWDGSGWRRVLLGEIGAWADFPVATALLRVSPASVDDSAKYVDGQLSLTRTRERLDVSALAATRWGSRLPFDPTGTRTWASIAITAWATPVLGIVGAGGTYPVDPVLRSSEYPRVDYTASPLESDPLLSQLNQLVQHAPIDSIPVEPSRQIPLRNFAVSSETASNANHSLKAIDVSLIRLIVE